MVSELRSYLTRLSHWGQQSVNRRILIAAVVVGSLALLAKLASLLKDLVVAHQFGTTPPLAAFSMAFTLISFAINLVAGSFNAALIPTYIQVREHEGQAAAQRLFSNVVLWSTALLLVVSVFLALIVSYIFPFLASGFMPEELALTHLLFLLLLPILVITGLATTWATVLNAG